jgi:glutamate carboxypeptidase
MATAFPSDVFSAEWGDALTQTLQSRYDAYLRDLESLVNLDSGSYDPSDVAQVEAWLRARCASWGAEFASQSGGGTFADGFAATIHGQGQGTVVLLGHMDTVFAHGAARERPFRLEGSRALGPGVCDMKGGLLAAIYAVESVRSLGFDRYATLRLICNGDEEIGSISSRGFIEEQARGADAVFVLEAARENGDIVRQRRGMGAYRLTVQGRSAHAGVEPQKGRSAALSLCQQVIALHALNDYATGRTVNVGVLSAGTRPNVVPDHAEAEVDLRADTIPDMEQLLGDAEVALAGSALEGTTYAWEQTQYRPPWGPLVGTDALVEMAQQIGATLGMTFAAVKTGGTSDGNFTAAQGIPTLDGLGPIGGLDHSPQEYIDCASIVPRTALLAGLIMMTGNE